LAVNRAGAAVVAWQSNAARPVDTTIDMAVRARQAAGFGPPERAAPARGGDGAVTIASDGTIAMAYTRAVTSTEDAAFGGLVLRVRPPGGRLGPVLRLPLPEGRAGFLPSPAFVGRGTPAVVYQHRVVGGSHWTSAAVRVTRSRSGGRFTRPVKLDPRPAKLRELVPLSAGRLLVLSAARTWSGSLVSARGIRRTAAPRGWVWPYADRGGNRAAAGAGSWAAVVWEDKRSGTAPSHLRVAIRHF
jgi:hypothetical protein